MRAFVRLAALCAAVTLAVMPALAQVVLRGNPTSRDSVRVFIAQRATAEDVRAIYAELEALFASSRRLQNELRAISDADRTTQSPERVRERVLAVQDGMRRVYSELYPRQSELTLACASLRAASSGRDGYLGISFGPRFTIQSPRAGIGIVSLDVPRRIDFVTPGSPAEKAGVRVGEEWLGLAGRPVAELANDELDKLLKPGSRVVMRLRADGRERDVTVVVAKHPEFPGKECEVAGGFAIAAPFPEMFIARIPGSGEVRSQPATGRVVPPDGMLFTSVRVEVQAYGATFRTLDADARDVVKVDGDAVLVDHVSHGTPAHAAGLRAFDVVTRVNGQSIGSPLDLRRLSISERTLVLTVVRGGETRTVTLARP